MIAAKENLAQFAVACGPQALGKESSLTLLLFRFIHGLSLATTKSDRRRGHIMGQPFSSALKTAIS
jgi:hypothetical protein